MAVTIGQDALGNAIVTGDNNQTFVFYGMEKLPEGLLADIQSGRSSRGSAPAGADFSGWFRGRYPDAVEDRGGTWRPSATALVIESDDDRILALPWELIRVDERFAVHDGRLDVARSVPSGNAPLLAQPAAPFSLLVNISAPEESGLDYERESYAIVRALHEH